MTGCAQSRDRGNWNAGGLDAKQVKGRERSPCQGECQLLPGQARRSLALHPGGAWVLEGLRVTKGTGPSVGPKGQSLGVKTKKAAGNRER